MTEATLAKTYELSSTPPAFTVDGEPFPWHIAQEGPRIEQIEAFEDRMHILWVPVLIDHPAPAYAHDKPGEPYGSGDE